MRAIYCLAAILVSVLAVGAHAQVINPLLFVNSSMALPVGIASYGLQNMYADSGPYVISTNEIFGYAKINSIYAYNSSAAYQLNISAWGVSLQENIMLNITVNGQAYAYWLQNVADINASNMTYYVIDNIWNATIYNAGIVNATLVGRGNVTGIPASFFNPANNTYYSYSTNSMPYAFPFYFKPIIRLTYNHGYPYVQFGYLNGSLAVFYDNVTFLVPNATAELVVTPYNQTGGLPNSYNSSLYYDAELTFGGEANGATTAFERMNSTLWLGYLAHNGSITAFPTVATFGSDSEENATNIDVVQDGGYALVRTGQPGYNSTLTLSGVPPGLVVPGPPVPPTVPTTTTINASAPFGSFGLGSGGSTGPSNTSIYIIILVLLVLAYAYIKIRGRSKNVTQNQP
jgi:thermopsin